MADNEAQLGALQSRLDELTSKHSTLPAKTVVREQLRFSADAAKLMSAQLQLASDAPMLPEAVRVQLEVHGPEALAALRRALDALARAAQGAGQANGHGGKGAGTSVAQGLAAEDAQLQGQEESIQVGLGKRTCGNFLPRAVTWTCTLPGLGMA